MTNARRGLYLMLGGSVATAGFLTCFKLGAGLGDVSDATLIMLASAAVLNSVASSVQEGGRIRIPTDRLSLVLSLVLSSLTLAANECAVVAVSRISPALTSVLQQTQILFVAVGMMVVLRERLTPRFWAGTAIAGVGLVLLQLSPGKTATFDTLGSLLAVLSAALFGVMAIVTRIYIHRIRPVAVNALRLWVALGLWFLVHRRLPYLPMRGDFVVYCALAGGFGPFLSRTAIMYALSYVSPTQTTLVQLTTPAITLIPSFLVFGAVPTARELTGGAIMLAGIALPVLERLGHDGSLDAAHSADSERAAPISSA